MEDIQTIVEAIQRDLQGEKSEEEILQRNLPFFGRDPESDLQVVGLLSSIRHVKIAGLLHRMLLVSQDKKVRKIIKRSLYRLKSKGFSIEEVPEKKKSSVLRPLQTEPPKGLGGGFDLLGQRFLVLAIPHLGRGWTVMQGVVSDTQGLIDFSGEQMNRKGLKAFLNEVEQRSPFPLVEMEPPYVGFLFHKAHPLTLDKKRALPQDYLSLKSEIEGIKKDYERPLIYSFLQEDEVTEEDRMLRRGGELLKADILSTWRIEDDLIRPYADEVWEAEESKIVLNQSQKETRFQGIYQRALSDLFSGERRSLYQQRLEETAYIFLKLGREEEAKISLAAAIDLAKPASPLQPNPFLFQLVIKSIFTLLKEAYEKKVKEPSLIVKP
ncbi:MAG: hypothetical protein ACE144_13145 [Thermodesulfobacteriota bacterium]